jgi:hypothetical protein
MIIEYETYKIMYYYILFTILKSNNYEIEGVDHALYDSKPRREYELTKNC